MAEKPAPPLMRYIGPALVGAIALVSFLGGMYVKTDEADRDIAALQERATNHEGRERELLERITRLEERTAAINHFPSTR